MYVCIFIKLTMADIYFGVVAFFPWVSTSDKPFFYRYTDVQSSRTTFCTCTCCVSVQSGSVKYIGIKKYKQLILIYSITFSPIDKCVSFFIVLLFCLIEFQTIKTGKNGYLPLCVIIISFNNTHLNIEYLISFYEVRTIVSNYKWKIMEITLQKINYRLVTKFSFWLMK